MPKIRLTEEVVARDIFLFDLPSASSYAAYASASDVANLCRNLLGPDENFSTSSSPSLTAVNTWLSSGCSVIETNLASDGWLVPIAETTLLFSWLRDLNALYAAARAEMSRINVTLGPGERTRGQIFEENFWKQLERVCNADLAAVGATKSDSGLHSNSLFVGGTSVASKNSYQTNSDRVKPRFAKQMFDLPGTIKGDSDD